jgi:hypothetical protein
LVTGYACDPRTADLEFALSKKEYFQNTGRDQKDRNILAFHIRQAFKPGEITPKEANKIGYELAMSFTKDRHAFIVATHIDKRHVHNHIIFNSTESANSNKIQGRERMEAVRLRIFRLQGESCSIYFSMKKYISTDGKDDYMRVG